MGYWLEVFIRLVRQVVMCLMRLGVVLVVVSLSFRIHLFANGVENAINPTILHHYGLCVFIFQCLPVCLCYTTIGAKVAWNS